MADIDKLAVTGFIFFLIILIFYFIVLGAQYRKLTSSNERLVVLITRTALFLPLYAFFIFISLCAPEALSAMEIFIAIVEGYSFYCFLSLMVTNMGGAAACVNYMKETNRELFCCTACCPSEKAEFYKKTTWGMFHFLVTRVIVTIIASICFYAHSKLGKALNVIFSLVAFVILIYALLRFVLLYENIYDKSKNLNGIVKVWLLKFSVGLIVLQGLVEEFMIAFGAEPYDDDATWTKEDKTERGYCILVLLEFVILLIPYTYAFTIPVEPSPSIQQDSNAAPSAPTFMSFLCQVLSFHDVFGTLTLKDGMTESLTK